MRINRIMIGVGVMVFVAIAVSSPAARGAEDTACYTQSPDPNGWDVNPHSQCRELADDIPNLPCTGKLTRIDIWVSFAGYNDTVPPGITGNFTVRLHGDNGGEPTCGALWSRCYGPGCDYDYTIEHAGNGDQGWYDIPSNTATENDHTQYFKVSFDTTGANQPEANLGSWLVVALPSNDPQIGWKTSTYPRTLDPQNDEPAKFNALSSVSPVWFDIIIAEHGYANFAYALHVPEPATLSMVGLGLLGMIRRKR